VAQLINRCVCGDIEPDATPTWHCPVHGGPLEQRTEMPPPDGQRQWEVFVDGRWHKQSEGWAKSLYRINGWPIRSHLDGEWVEGE